MKHTNSEAKKFVFATGNPNKLKEIRFVASKYNIEIFSPAEIAKRNSLEKFIAPPETGLTYLENALIKAKSCFAWCGLPAIGDDSGIEAEILNNAPGIYSARYAGDNASDKERYEKLLKEIKQATQEQQQENQNGRFRCALALILEETTQHTAESVLEGKFLTTPRGERGFGYDPILEITEFSATLAEVPTELVLNHGFRAKAAKKLFENL